eukprot:15353399-Ditylum_brightwellii.AAC.1
MMKLSNEKTQQSIDNAKETMKQDMNAMRAEITSILRTELQSMVKKSTKEAIEDIQAKMQEYMTSEV